MLTTEFISLLDGHPYERVVGSSVGRSRNAKIGRFLAKNAAALGIRYVRSKKVRDALGGRTTTAVWERI